ncbi:MAG: YMGG-like glycine zipper-containing protein [Ginsengibacter sp.]
MKNFLLAFALITGVAACNTTPRQDESRDIQLLTDSTAYHNNFYSDTSSAVKVEPIKAAEVPAAPKVITITKRIIYTPAKTVNEAPVSQPQVNNIPTATPVPVPTNGPVTTTTDNTTQTGSSTSTGTDPVATTTPQEKKKGWSSAAKGAAIGAGAGAIGGAIISKKKGLGAVVGGVVGAAGGYIIGKDIDKRKAGN